VPGGVAAAAGPRTWGVLRPRNITAETLARWHHERPAVTLFVPMTEFVPRVAVAHLMKLSQNLRGDDQIVIHVQTSAIHFARNHAVQTFLDDPNHKDCQYLVMIDDDMTIDPNWVDILTWAEQPFVSALCVRKSPPFIPTPALLQKQSDEGYHYAPIKDWKPNTGLRECDAVGAAVICVRRDVLEAMERPWFDFREGGEDYFFCRKVRGLGHKILVDTALLAGHLQEMRPATYWNWLDSRAAYEKEHGEPLTPEAVTGAE
jgi:hypothetical protein